MTSLTIHSASASEHLCPCLRHRSNGQMFTPDFTSTSGTRLVGTTLHEYPAAVSREWLSLSSALLRPITQRPPAFITA